MKKRNMIIVNTYFQLITAINLAMNNFSNDYNDIVITNCSVGTKDKVELIKKSGLFQNVYYIESRELINGNKLKKYLIYLFNRRKIIGNINNNKYDEILFYNFDVLCYALIDELFKYNKSLICSRFDEGFSTYTINHKSNRINNLIRKILFRKNINKSIKKIYLYHPELLCYETNYNIEVIPNIDKNNKLIKETLNSIFNYNQYNITQKYIFFEESFFCDNKGIEDFDLIMNIANIVGKENLIIKLHPRNKVDRFSKHGIKVWESTGIPWEIYQMNEDYRKKVFLTISSGSILASKLYFNENIESYFLYNCTEKMSDMVTTEFYSYLELVKKNMKFDSIIIPKNEEEFYSILKGKK